MAEVKSPPYDPDDPNMNPAYRPPETVWVEGDHPTDNPDGVTVSNHDYTPKTQEEKAELLNVEMVEPVEIDPNAAYPEGDPPGMAERAAMLRRIHSPMELVSAKDRAETEEAALLAGGALPPGEIENSHLEEA